MHDHHMLNSILMYMKEQVYKRKIKKKLNLISQSEPELWPFKEIGVENDY